MNIQFEFKSHDVNISSTDYNTSIIDSYRFKKIRDMKGIITQVRMINLDNDSAIRKRHRFSMINEWRAHNLLYALHIKRERTKSVDLNINQGFLIKVAYTLLSACYMRY